MIEVIRVTNIEKSKIILSALDNYMTINWNMEDVYLKAIAEALLKINRNENSHPEIPKVE